MSPGADPAFQQAMDKLLLQVDQDNVLAVHRAFQQHADELWNYLDDTRRKTSFRKCGEDPVSVATLGDSSFRGKIDALFRVHWDHQRELQTVADRLKQTALEYGHTDEEVAASLDQTHSR